MAKLDPPPRDWRPVHIGFENDAFTLEGLQVWKEKWRRTSEPTVELPHPAYQSQIDRFVIYEIGDPDRPVRFAATELSAGVYGFYVPR